MSESKKTEDVHSLRIRICEECEREFVGNTERCPSCVGKPASKPLSHYKMLARTAKPSARWYLLPLLFGIIGGLIGYVVVRDKDEDMAGWLLGFGVFVFYAWIFFIYFILLS